MSWFSILEVVVKGRSKFIWVLYSGNNHEVLRSARSFNKAHHARDAARRLHKIVCAADFNYGRGFRDARRRTVPA